MTKIPKSLEHLLEKRAARGRRQSERRRSSTDGYTGPERRAVERRQCKRRKKS